MQHANVPADTIIAIEDTHKGLTSAKAAGLSAFGIRNEINDTHELRLADHIVDDYHLLKNLLMADNK